MADFHFLRPAWLLVLPAGLALLWACARRQRSGARWRDVCDPALLPHLLERREGAAPTLPALLMGCGLLLATLALAGPAWQRQEEPVHRVREARIVVLDLSRSMDSPDLAPSRLARARLKAADLFARTREGQAGLVVYAGDAYRVSPLTDDAETLNALLPALATDLMPVPGSRPDLGLRRAGELLARAGLRHGEVILIADSAGDFRAVEAAADLARAGFRVSVLAAGSAEGAPIPLSGGGFLKDEAGDIVVPRLAARGLREVARAGGGPFVAMSSDDRDLDTLLARPPDERWRLETEAGERDAPVWRDEGPWLVLALLPVAALAFRRGWLLAIGCLLWAPADPAGAFDWRDLWARPDQQAARALARGDPAAAFEAAAEARWRAPALYRDREFAAAAEAYAEQEGAAAHYNRGNALAKSGRLREALDAYDAALSREAGFEDAVFNRAIVERLLRERESSSPGGGEERAPEGAGGRSPGPGGARPEEPPSPDGDPRGEGGGERPEAARDGTDPPAGAPRDARGAGTRDAANPDGAPEAESGGTRGARPATSPAGAGEAGDERRQALEQWLRRIPDDPGGLLRRKFALDHARRGHPDPDSARTW